MLTDGRTDDGRKVITIAHPEQSSGELKIKQACLLCVLSIKTKSNSQETPIMTIRKLQLQNYAERLSSNTDS